MQSFVLYCNRKYLRIAGWMVSQRMNLCELNNDPFGLDDDEAEAKDDENDQNAAH